jgi:N-acetylmuramoyl-L-alanine amidase
MSAASASAAASAGNEETLRTSTAVRSADISRVEQMSIESDLNYQVGSTTVTNNNSSATRENAAPNNAISTSSNGAQNNAINNPTMNSNSNLNPNSNAIENANVTGSGSSSPMANSNVSTSESSNPIDNSSDVDEDYDDTNHLYTSHLTHTIFSSATVSDRPVIIVIDPGHGGKDPGATGPMGLHEKTVTLEIAEDLKHLIDKQKGMHAVLTRTGDYYVGLRDRLAIARQDKGDMFIAIHADAAPAISGYEATGATVYALSLHGASSEAARWIAEKENYSELGGIDLDTIQDSDNMLRSVLIDLSQTATISDSLILGRSVLHQLSDLSPLHHDVVEQAPFMVLKSPDIPSILVETGYITNPQEETDLRNPLYQEELAHAMLDGIRNYFVHYAPPGSWLASNHDALKGKDTRNI